MIHRSNNFRAHLRLFIVMVFFIIFGGALLARLFYLQVLNYHVYVALAAKQGGSAMETIRRGTIFFTDKDGLQVSAALNKDTFTLSAVPKEIPDALETASQLATVLTLNATDTVAKLSKKNDSYEILSRKLDDVIAAKVIALNIPGIELERQSRRTYPGGSLAASVIGYASLDQDIEVGKYGIEKLFNDKLSGSSGILDGIKNTSDYVLNLTKRIIYQSRSGQNIVLTIDPNIQDAAQRELDSVVKKYDGENGTMTIVDPMTGRILALASTPGFDPNVFNEVVDVGVFLNRAVQASYELGSVMKPVTMAAGINENLVNPSTTYYDAGTLYFGGSTVQNFDKKSNGTQTMTQVLEKSLNTGAVFVEQKLGKAKMEAYLRAFGFGEKTGVDLPGEISGNLSNLKYQRDIDFATASFGQGIAVTPIQMAMALSVIVNGGNLMKPYVVDKITDDSGVIQTFEPQVRRRVISEVASKTVRNMLVTVAETGFEHRAQIDGYNVGAKTGTAQIPNSNGKGYSDQVIHSFFGFAPANNPRFLVFIQLNRPQGVNFASNSLTTTFHDIAEYILHYYGVAPDKAN